jgi:hypothetical protein
MIRLKGGDYDGKTLRRSAPPAGSRMTRSNPSDLVWGETFRLTGGERSQDYQVRSDGTAVFTDVRGDFPIHISEVQ